MSIKNSTHNLGLPLPAESNELEFDLPRLREAFQKLDSFAGSVNEQLPKIDNIDLLAAAIDSETKAREEECQNFDERLSSFEGQIKGGIDAALLVSGTVEAARLPLPLAIEHGGTGGNSIVQARLNLGLSPLTEVFDNIVYITESGTWTPPVQRRYYVIIQGAGGGAGGYGGCPGGGGGAGGQGIAVIDGDPDIPWNCTIADGGAAGSTASTTGGGGSYGGNTILEISGQAAYLAGGGGGGSGGSTTANATAGAGGGGGGFGYTAYSLLSGATTNFALTAGSAGLSGSTVPNAGGNGRGWGAGIGGDASTIQGSCGAGRAGVGSSGGGGRCLTGNGGGTPQIALPNHYGEGGNCFSSSNVEAGNQGCIVIMW